jgi:hypothetical protein
MRAAIEETGGLDVVDTSGETSSVIHDPKREAEDDDRRWLTPDEEAGVFEIDPWTSVLDNWAEEIEHPFPYPSGLP